MLLYEFENKCMKRRLVKKLKHYDMTDARSRVGGRSCCWFVWSQELGQIDCFVKVGGVTGSRVQIGESTHYPDENPVGEAAVGVVAEQEVWLTGWQIAMWYSLKDGLHKKLRSLLVEIAYFFWCRVELLGRAVLGGCGEPESVVFFGFLLFLVHHHVEGEICGRCDKLVIWWWINGGALRVWGTLPENVNSTLSGNHSSNN